MGEMYAFDPIADSIDNWIEELEDFMLTHHGQCDEHRLKSALKTLIGEEGRKVIRNLPPENKTSFALLSRALRDHYKTRPMTFVERNTFFRMFMEEGEPVDNYTTRLRAQAAKCNFRVLCTPATEEQPAVYHDLKDEFIRDRLIVSINDSQTKQQLLQKTTQLTLQQTLEIIRSAEEASKNMKRMVEEKSDKAVNLLRAKQSEETSKNTPFGLTSNKPQKRQKKGDGVEYFCAKYCGQRHIQGRCPAYGKTCTQCGKMHHFKLVCRSLIEQYPTSLNSVTNSSYSSGDSSVCSSLTPSPVLKRAHQQPPSTPQPENKDWGLFLGMIEMREVESNEDGIDWSENVTINGKPIQCKVDTGAQANVIAHSILKKNLGVLKLMETSVQLRAYNDTSIPCSGKVNLKCRFNNQNFVIPFYVVPIEAKTIIGLKSSVEMGIVDLKKRSQVNEISQTTGDQDKVDKNISKLQSQFEKLKMEHKDVFDNSRLGILGKPYDIKLAPGAVPVVHASRTTPFAVMEKVQIELDRMQLLGVITKVDEPTDWVNSMVVVQRGEKTRICLDPSSLNKSILREHTILPTPDEILARIRKARIFSKLDLKDGYWQVPLTEGASQLTTFNTPFGRYRYTRLPFGLSSANEVFQKRVGQEMENVKNASYLYDDILIHTETEEEHEIALREVLGICLKSGIKLNQEKCQMGVSQIKYLVHLIAQDGISPDPEKIEDLVNMPQPKDKAGAQRLLGSLTYLAKFIPDLATLTEPIRNLLNKRSVFQWTFEHKAALEEIKHRLSTAPILAFYDVNEEVTISCDASGTGLGACLFQNEHPIAYASRSLTETECSYAQIEKEMLAIVYACDRFYQYIFTKTVTVETDHQSLITVFQRPFECNPARLQRFLIRLQRYSISPVYVPGKDLPIPDMLSRAHIRKDLTDDQLELENDCKMLISSIVAHTNCSSGMMIRLKEATTKDPTLLTVMEYVENGWPKDQKGCKPTAKMYWSDREYMSVQDGLVLYENRLVIPYTLQQEILERIHEGHQGQERCKSLARQSVYWRGMNSDIKEVVSKCSQCLLHRKAPARQPLISHEIPNEAWHKVAIDIFSHAGSKYQLFVDYFSKWIEIEKFSGNPNTAKTIKQIKSVCSRHGYMHKLCSDGDSVYTSWEFENFCKEYDIEHVVSSPHHPRSNGQVEIKIQFAKKLISKCSLDEMDNALLQYRATPLGTGLGSPAELMNNRMLRTRLPSVVDKPVTDLDKKRWHDKLLDNQKSMKFYHDRTVKNNVNVFKPGDIVRYRDDSGELWSKEGQITRQINSRSYELVNSHGNLLCRNSRLLQQDNSTAELPIAPPTQVQMQPTNTVNPAHRSATVKNLNPIPLPLNNPVVPFHLSPDNNGINDPPPILRRSERLKLKNQKSNG